METKEWRTADKSKWGPGDWQDEPDKMQWTTKAGLPGLIVRNYGGALCGYAGVSEGHPYFAVDYDGADVRVHGGLTYADFCQPHEEEGEARGVCHVPGEGEPDRVWWLGFDCSHLGDIAPAYDFDRVHKHYGYAASYRNISYVKSQVEKLAAQLVREGGT